MSKLRIIKLSQDFVREFDSIATLDYSIESVARIEDYLFKTVNNNGKIKSNSFFATHKDYNILKFGCYLGEVIRRNSYATKWDNSDLSTPIEMSIKDIEGGVVMVMNKAFKRVYEGDADNTYHFVKIIIEKHLVTEGDIPIDFYGKEDQRIIKFKNNPLSLYSKKIEQNDGQINHIIGDKGQWVFLFGGEDEDRDQEEVFDLLFLDEIKEKHPELRDQLSSEKIIKISRQNDGSFRSQETHKGLFFDEDSMASFQGNMNINYIQWIKTNPLLSIKKIGSLIISFLLMIKFHWLFVLVFIGALLYNFWYWISLSNKFKGGDVNPGKVISINPNLVAIATNMTKMVGSYPILKIIETNLLSKDKKIGKIIPTVALYNENPHDYPFWSEFHPVPVSLGIKNQKQIEFLLSEFSSEDINMLNEYLEQTKDKKKGVYKIINTESNWDEYEHVDMNLGVSMAGPDEKHKK